jgi:hypothetical protein
MSGGEHIQACAKEFLVTEAVARGMLLPEDLRGHAETCPVCSEAALVGRSLGQILASGMEDPLPSGTFTLWRLNLRMHLERKHRAWLPLTWMRRISLATWIVMALAFWRWQLPDLPVYSATLVTGLIALGAVTLPVSIALWCWSRAGRRRSGRAELRKAVGWPTQDR